MRIALVHDYLNQYGGGERVLEAFSEIWPDAPIYTLIYDAEKTKNVFEDKEIYTSFLQKIPFVKKHHRSFLLLMPVAIEQFDLSDYDVVLSDSASYAKGVITNPNTLHLCYCHTPTRYLWDDCHKYVEEFQHLSFLKNIAPFFLSSLRLWDKAAADRVDKFIANSNFVASRINKYYLRDADTIYPPVKTDFFKPHNDTKNVDGDYFLITARLLSYKKVDLAIEAFNRLGLPLVVVGDGREKKSLLKIAKNNIKFVGIVSDEELKNYYCGCRAFIFPQEEDFGIAPVEAMACGRPIIAYQAGGALETVKDGETGIFFREQTIESLIEAVKNFERIRFDNVVIRQHALQFDKENFKEKIKDFVEREWKDFKKSS